MSDEEHDAEIKEAMKRTPVVVGQPASEALEALGVRPDGLSVAKSKHDEKELSSRITTTRLARGPKGCFTLGCGSRVLTTGVKGFPLNVAWVALGSPLLG